MDQAAVETTNRESPKRATLVKVLLICGIVSSLLYIAVDVLAAMSWQAYSYAHQSVSELSAIGAPTRGSVVAIGMVYILLVIAFSAGVWLSAGPKRSLRISAILLAAYGIVNLPGAFFSMRLRGEGSLAADAGHLILTIVTVILLLLAVGFGSGADGRWFRLYSIATVVAMLTFGAAGATQAPAVGAGQPTPWLGLVERVSVYAPILWMLVLALVLLRSDNIDRAMMERTAAPPP